MVTSNKKKKETDNNNGLDEKGNPFPIENKNGGDPICPGGWKIDYDFDIMDPINPPFRCISALKDPTDSIANKIMNSINKPESGVTNMVMKNIVPPAAGGGRGSRTRRRRRKGSRRYKRTHHQRRRR
jgi:hypothetical protein